MLQANITTAGTAQRRTISVISRPAIPEIAIMTPATGDMQRPIPALSYMGSAMVAAGTPI